MKNTFIIILVLVGRLAFGQSSFELKCPPCRPVMSCDKCWETEQQAMDACNPNSRITSTFGQFNNADKFSLNVFPNPSSNGSFFIENTKRLEGNVSIIDQSGRLVREFKLNSGVQLFMFGEEGAFAPGMYHLRFVNSKDGRVITRKLIVPGKN